MALNSFYSSLVLQYKFVLVGLSIILFEAFPEKSIWSIPVRQADEHMTAVPAS